MTSLQQRGKRLLRAVLARFFALYPRLMRFAIARRLNRILLEAGLRGLGVGNYETLAASGEAGFVSSVLARLVPPAPVFVDVGAHDGEFARLLLERFPRARVHALEPHPVTYRRLLTTMGARVNAESLALGESPGTLRIWDYGDLDGSPHASMYRQAIAELRHAEPVVHEVPVSTLDDWMLQHDLDHIDFLKIDTEGAELAILRGASATLASGAIGVIQFEFNEMNVYSRSFFKDFADVLSHYHLYRLLPTGMLRLFPYVAVLHEVFAFQNIVAIKADLLPDPPAWLPCR